MSDEELRQLALRFQDLSAYRVSIDDLIKDLLTHCHTSTTSLRRENEQLLASLQDCQLDLADATTSRRELQQKLRQADARIGNITQDNDMLKNRNLYVAILIDGDGLLFKETFLNQGLEGGKRAAYALRSAILAQCGAHASDIEVVAKVCANITGLTRALRREGSIEFDSELKDFTLGFTQAKASFDFVDVGYGKERADRKIQEAAKWHLGNPNCKQVILGISHDAGYAPFLDEILQDDDTRRRVTVVEGVPIVRELRATGVNVLDLNDDIFRSEKIVQKPFALSLPTPPSAMSPPPPSATPPSTSGPVSYAGIVTSASPPPVLTMAIQSKPVNLARKAAKPPPPWNPGSRGIDPPLNVNQATLDHIKKRKDSSKLCNNHFLRGPCTKGDGCCFEHNYKPTAEEKVAIAYLARQNPCTNGQDCDVEDCIYGHHCPSTVNGQCMHPYCKYRPDEHPPNTKFRSTYNNGNYSDY